MISQTFHDNAVHIAREEWPERMTHAMIETSIVMRFTLHGTTSEWKISFDSKRFPERGVSVVGSGPEVLEEFRNELRFVAGRLEREAVRL